ncbi:hypothetical protein ACFL2V_20410, partial [Pseudomonadota bacterium]
DADLLVDKDVVIKVGEFDGRFYSEEARDDFYLRSMMSKVEVVRKNRRRGRNESMVARQKTLLGWFFCGRNLYLLGYKHLEGSRLVLWKNWLEISRHIVRLGFLINNQREELKVFDSGREDGVKICSGD